MRSENVVLAIILGGAMLLVGSERVRGERLPPDLLVEILLQPDVETDVVLEEARIRIWKDGRRLFSFRSETTELSGRRFVFLADPVTRLYRTVLFNREGSREADASREWEEQVDLVRRRLGRVDWRRLPSSRPDEPAWRRARAPSRSPSDEGMRGMVWVEGRSHPVSEERSGDSVPSEDCRSRTWVVLETLEPDFLPLTATSAGFGPDTIAENGSQGGACWSSNSDSGGRRWVVQECRSIWEDPRPGNQIEFAHFSRYAAFASAGNPIQILQVAGFETGDGGLSALQGVFAVGDWASPDRLFWGAVTEIPGDCR